MKKIFALLFALFCFVRMDARPDLEFCEPYAVGELGEAWQFPSDHLPIGATLGSFHIAFWNTLNKEYLGHIEANTQGLQNSSILKDHLQVDSKESLTLREQIVGNMVMEMINHPTHTRSLIALQEVHPDLQDYLRLQIPDHFRLITPIDQPYSQDLFLYDQELFEFVSTEAVLYNKTAPKSIFTLTLKERATGKIFRFMQSHVPGGPIKSKEGCEKFSQEALRQYDPTITTVLMGDMNQLPQVIDQALKLATGGKNLPDSPYRYLPICYPSHVNTSMEATWIDHFFIYTPEEALHIQGSNNPEEISAHLIPLVILLQRRGH